VNEYPGFLPEPAQCAEKREHNTAAEDIQVPNESVKAENHQVIPAEVRPPPPPHSPQPSATHRKSLGGCRTIRSGEPALKPQKELQPASQIEDGGAGEPKTGEGPSPAADRAGSPGLVPLADVLSLTQRSQSTVSKPKKKKAKGLFK
ncbi:hypothetical protein AB205_0185430, partial [Aquarana catesbeiana]